MNSYKYDQLSRQTRSFIDQAHDMRARVIAQYLRNGFAHVAASLKKAVRFVAIRHKPGDFCSQR